MTQHNSTIETTSIMQNVVPQSYKLEGQQALALVLKLCQSLTTERIDYCHWKSNEALARSASGDNDLDLLVSRADAERFTEILFRLGFRETQENADSKLPGVLNYYGYDTEMDRLIHVHAHYQLVLGSDLSKNYRIPVERSYLDSARQTGLFRVPAPEFELVIFVLRMVLKHSTWDSILMRLGVLSPSEHREFEYLATAENLGKAKSILKQYLPYVDQALFDACVQVLQPRCSLVKRILTGEQLQAALEACARNPKAMDIVSKFSRWIWLFVHVRLFRQKLKRRLANGGLLIAVVGGDGSGKTTAIEGLYGWLSEKFDVMKVHLGKPAWSWPTIAIRGLLKIGTMLGLYAFEEYSYTDGAKFPGYPWLIRTVCIAHDRYLTYLEARRFTSNGGLVICDRYPLSDFQLMDTPQCARIAKSFGRSNWFLSWLTRIETSYYQKITLPDLLIVLKLNPEIAVQRKTDESAVSVYARSTSVWNSDWSKIPAHILDASLPKDEVLAQVKSLVWKSL